MERTQNPNARRRGAVAGLLGFTWPPHNLRTILYKTFQYFYFDRFFDLLKVWFGTCSIVPVNALPKKVKVGSLRGLLRSISLFMAFILSSLWALNAASLQQFSIPSL
jgi:hypothetical protein